MDEICEGNEISPLLDMIAGTWTLNSVNYGQKLYKIAVACLEEKKKRPTMVDVVEQLISICKDLLADG